MKVTILLLYACLTPRIARIFIYNFCATHSIFAGEDRKSLFTRQGWNFKWRTLVKIAGNNQNLKRFLYSKPDFDCRGKILAVFDG